MAEYTLENRIWSAALQRSLDYDAADNQPAARHWNQLPKDLELVLLQGVLCI